MRLETNRVHTIVPISHRTFPTFPINSGGLGQVKHVVHAAMLATQMPVRLASDY
jgi:hypothetical protein